MGSIILPLSDKDTLDIVSNIYHEPKHTGPAAIKQYHNKRNITNRPGEVTTTQTFESQV